VWDLIETRPGCSTGVPLAYLRWGLIHAWAGDPSIGDRLANARSEAAATKPSFRRGFRSRRCLVVADGFYEWRRASGRKQSYFVGLPSDRPFGLAGLWERWEKHGGPVESCTILTTEANELMRPIHERMPVIVPPDHYGLWLDPRCQDAEKLAELLRPYPSTPMLAYRVGTLVNNARNDVPQCAEEMR
jgi:putative SOS response-associated peptidase YedK